MAPGSGHTCGEEHEDDKEPEIIGLHAAQGQHAKYEDGFVFGILYKIVVPNTFFLDDDCIHRSHLNCAHERSPGSLDLVKEIQRMAFRDHARVLRYVCIETITSSFLRKRFNSVAPK